MTFQSTIQKIKAGQVDPIYLLLGEEKFLIQEFENQLSRAVIGDQKAVSDFNFVRLDLEEHSLEEALVEANTISFFSEPKIIWLTKPIFLSTEKGKKEENTQALLDYLAEPAPDVTLVFVCDFEKLDGRKKVVKQLKKAANLVDVSLADESTTTNYIKDYVRNAGYLMDRSVLQLFLERTNYQLSNAMNELEKLFLFVGQEDRISKHDVETVVSPSLDNNIFHLTDYVMAHRLEAALDLYRTLIQEKHQPIAILALLEANFRLFSQIALLARTGYDQGAIAKSLGAHPYRVKMSMKQMRSYDGQQLLAAYQDLVELDYEIKSGQVDPNLGIEWFILRFAA
ncbi:MULTISPECIES: DNA polymerase III subunit delta [Aerococcus]|uniref:DNA polymerase III subunit delta n=3 Tax=Aerococcus TaxID=1375 RepID=A0A178HBQ7_9LACT|nr:MULTISPECIES: DNA polymerase III subunit delta [Aerococcus]KAA9219946.1 DNA polymerase III subunit delta [Aerococcus loyolae]KAA9265898.1 DNA polymerase III subunit delta [Aerococcus loyolae]MCY3024893.1 DNA polymerase III subunit delta [Aerococcus loyolae]MCY3026847.1 DNA polymerase III subunit delta [Aerococcus loyolae]MDK6231723.1 DNA polymerase III subunit delta [Aerococcus urinae]